MEKRLQFMAFFFFTIKKTVSSYFCRFLPCETAVIAFAKVQMLGKGASAPFPVLTMPPASRVITVIFSLISLRWCIGFLFESLTGSKFISLSLHPLYFSKILLYYLFCMCEHFAWMYLCAACVCVLPEQHRRGCLGLWNWSRRHLWATLLGAGNQNRVLWKVTQCS